MSFRAKREILKWHYAEKRRFLPAVEMTDSLRGTFYEAVKVEACRSPLGRHSRESGSPGSPKKDWIPAYAGMTGKSVSRLLTKPSFLKLGKLSSRRHNVNNARMQRAHPREIMR
jgi:hypothetical protein